MSSIPPSAKPHFANRALRFANATRLGRIAVWALFAVAAATLLGPFGTGDLPPGERAAFWFALIGWNLAKWELVIRILLPRGCTWRSVLLIGTVIMLLTIPVEVTYVIRILTGAEPGPLHGIALRAAALTLLGLGGLLLASRWLPRTAQAPLPAPESRFTGTSLRLTEIAAILAEDHYVRLCLPDGASLLVHARFRDAVGQVAGIAGAQVHRGAWVADACVHGARRTGSRWFVLAAGGLELPVSRTHIAQVRALGWLGQRPLPRSGSID